ncbi:MAG TPA: chalcone isomerase family protein [Burkholderiales bacterium]
MRALEVQKILLTILLSVTLPAFAAEVAGVKIEDQVRVGGAELALTGAGLRKKLFFQVYAIGLYVADRKADLLAQPGPKRVAIRMLRDVDADDFIEALALGIKENHSAADAQALEPRVKQLGEVILAIKQAKKGMAIDLDWTASATQVVIDGKPAGAPIAGDDFYRALLRIWLGERPVQEDLKKALLGG